MKVTIVEIRVKERNVDGFISATLDNHRESVKEPGNLRFDVLQSIDDPTRFTLYEAYESDEAVAAHKKTAHYFRWRETVEDMMDGPRKGMAQRVIAPLDISLW